MNGGVELFEIARAMPHHRLPKGGERFLGDLDGTWNKELHDTEKGAPRQGMRGGDCTRLRRGRQIRKAAALPARRTYRDEVRFGSFGKECRVFIGAQPCARARGRSAARAGSCWPEFREGLSRFPARSAPAVHWGRREFWEELRLFA